MQQQAAIMASVAQGGYLNPMAAFAAAQMQQMAALNMNGLAAAPMTPTSGKGLQGWRGWRAGESGHISGEIWQDMLADLPRQGFTEMLVLLLKATRSEEWSQPDPFVVWEKREGAKKGCYHLFQSERQLKVSFCIIKQL